jgi:inositol transport system substrate-binding protein
MKTRRGKKMMKKVSLLLVLVLVIGLLAGCGGGTTGGDTGNGEESLTIGYASSNLNDTGQTFIADGARAYAAENGLEIVVQDGQEDVVRQQDQIKAMIEQGVDALVVVPVNTDAMGPITDAALEAGIPLIYVNRNPFGEEQPPEGVYYIGSQEIVAGRFQGEALVEMMGEEGNVAILLGMLTNQAAVGRTEGNKEIIAQYPGITILAEETGNWQRDQGLSLTENWLTAYGDDLNAILANNDEMALGAVQALQAAGREDVLVLGVDATPDAKEAVKAGTLAATVLQDLVGQGRGGVEIAHKLLMGESPTQVTWIDFVPVTIDNVDEF